MQATTFAIAVFGLSVVLGLCGQINLAQAAFFGFGAYAVGLGTSDYHAELLALPCWRHACIALLAGALLGMSTLRLGGHYLAMVTISFQQIVTLVMINCDLAHPRAGRRLATSAGPICFSRAQSLSRASASRCWRSSAIVVWHLPDTRLGRAMRAVRDNELAAGVIGIDVFRTKVYRLRAERGAGRIWRRAVRRRLCLCQPGPVLVRRVDRVPDRCRCSAARRRRSDRRSAPAC